MQFLVAFTCLLTIATAKPGHLGLAGHIAAPGFSYSSITAHAPAVAVAHHASLAAPAAVAHHAPLSAITHGVAPVAAPYHATLTAPAAITHHAAAIAAPAIATPGAVAHHASLAAPAAVAHHAPLTAIAHEVAPVATPYHATHHAAAIAAPIATPGAVAHHAALTAPAIPAPVAVTHHAAIAAPTIAAVATPVALEKTQYHAQDVFGQASYGHTEALQHHHAVQDAGGNKIGSYSWVAPSGQVVHGKYVADALGYRVHSNAIPVGPAPVGETPEVVAARSAHFAAHVAVKSHLRARRGIAAVATPAIAYTAAVTTPLHYTTHYAPTFVSPFIHTKALHYGLF